MVRRKSPISWPMSCSASDAASPTMAYPMKIYVEIEVSMGKSCTKGEFSIATFDYRSVNRPAHRQAARKCGVRSLRSLRWKCWWGDGWAVSDADNFYFLKMFAGLVSGLGGPMGTHGDPWGPAFGSQSETTTSETGNLEMDNHAADRFRAPKLETCPLHANDELLVKRSSQGKINSERNHPAFLEGIAPKRS